MNLRSPQRSVFLLCLVISILSGLNAPAMAGDGPPEPPAAPDAPDGPAVFVIEGDAPVFSWQSGHAEVFLGVTPVDLTAELCRHFGADVSGAVMIGRVEEDSPAAEAGLEVGDILLAVDGESIDSGVQLRARILRKKAGEPVSLDILRDGRRRELEATLASRERRGHVAYKWIGPMRQAQQAARRARAEALARFGDGDWLTKLKELEVVREKELRERIDQLEKKLDELAARMNQKSR
ncbi:MAG TPA: PDZ domain-containing protein [Acidobacteria bacterium]|nr:PDZ domain-containing protein [Acidobacteriota bacterium]